MLGLFLVVLFNIPEWNYIKKITELCFAEPVDDEVTGGETAVAGVRYTQHVRGAKYLEPTVQESKFSQERYLYK